MGARQHGIGLALFVFVAFLNQSAFAEYSNQSQIQAEIDRARPGDTVYVVGNIRLNAPLRIHGKKKLSLVGLSSPVLDAATRPKIPQLFETEADGRVVPWRGKKTWIPVYADFFAPGAVDISDSSDIKISGLKIINSWPNAVAITRSRSVTID